MIDRIKYMAFTPADIASLAVVRMLYGLMIMYESWVYSGENIIKNQFTGQIFYFKYRFFEWVLPTTTPLMQYILIAYGIAGFFLFLGIFYYLAAFIIFLCISYMFLIDATNYLNHFYLIIIFATLMCFIPAHKGWSLYAWVSPQKARSSIASWPIYLIRAQLIIVYSYAALAKMNVDWMNGMPLYDWIGGMASESGIESYLHMPWVIYSFSYGGLLYDLLVIPALLYKPTRALAYCCSIGFHLMNFYLFNIGIFPWFMLATTTIFFDSSWPRDFLHFFFPTRFMPLNLSHAYTYAHAHTPENLSWASRLGFAFIAAHLIFQLFFPLRHFLYPGYVGWSEEGHNFSWHMKLRDKIGSISFIIRDPVSGYSEVVNNSRYLMKRQIQKMACRPYLALQFAHFLRDIYTPKGALPVEVYAETWISINGREPQRLIDPQVNLAKIAIKEFNNNWILPLKQPVWNAFDKKNRFGPAFTNDNIAQKALAPRAANF